MKLARRPSYFRRNGLSLIMFALFLLSWTGQAFTGWMEHNQNLAEHGARILSFHKYLVSGHFIQATFENWESEFLQMFLYVLLTVWFYQQGSSESKSLEKSEAVDRTPVANPNAPWPVKKGGWVLKLYKNSLGLAFLLLFIVTCSLHAYGSYKDYVVEEQLHGRAIKDFAGFMAEPRFWFESFQNWQSEFLAVLSIVVLSIFLRQQGSPESKPVDAPHDETGE